MRYLVTGAAGQVGRYLTALLQQLGHDVVAFDRAFATPAPEQTVAGDLCDPAAISDLLADGRFDGLFHLAGLNALQPAGDIQRVNVGGTVNLLAAMSQLGANAPRLILMSSSAVYGRSSDDPITETTCLDPQTPYAASKAAAEEAALRYHAASGQDVRIARPFNIVGPGQRAPLLYAKVAALLVEIERAKRPPMLELGNLDSYRDFVDVRDVCTGLVAIAEQGQSAEVYNLCSGQATLIHSMVDALCAQAALRVEIRTQPRGATDVPYQRGSHAKLSALSGWRPQVTLDQSLRDTLTYWRDIAGSGNSD